MKQVRFSIGWLMVSEGIVALNLWAGRRIYSLEPWILAGAAPTGLTLEVALLKLFRTRGQARVFWAGLLAAGSFAAGSFICGIVYHESCFRGRGVNIVTGEKLTNSTPGLVFGRCAWRVWARYITFVVQVSERVELTSGILRRDGTPQVIGGAVVVFVPQLLLALAGGLTALLSAWLMGLRPRRQPSRAAPDVQT